MKQHKKNKLGFNPPRVPVIGMHFWSGRKPMDIDRDGVPDHKDCRPFDRRRHSITPSKTMEERIRRLPIKVREQGNIGGYHILSKEAQQPAFKELRQSVFGTIKKYPSVVGDIERKKPEEVVFTTRQASDAFADIGFERKDITVYSPEIHTKSKEEFAEEKEFRRRATTSYKDYPKELPLVKKEIEREFKKDIFPEETLSQDEEKTRKSFADSLHHELKHTEQISEGELSYDVAREYMHLHPFERPYEIEAMKYSKEKLSEYRKRKPTGEDITKTLGLD